MVLYVNKSHKTVHSGNGFICTQILEEYIFQSFKDNRNQYHLNLLHNHFIHTHHLYKVHH